MLQELIGLATNFVSGYQKGKEQLFHNHVEPLKTQIHEIHGDYMKSFMETRVFLHEKKFPTDEILAFLEQRRYELAAQRNLSINLATQIQQANRKVVSQHAWSAFIDFNQSVVDYFISANAPARASWYSDFINHMRISKALENAKFFDENSFGNDPRADMLEHVNVLIEKRLPSALDKVNRHYAVLRGALL